ncbi:hypothetical protein KI387_019155, partial [Taxus chinensis]
FRLLWFSHPYQNVLILEVSTAVCCELLLQVLSTFSAKLISRQWRRYIYKLHMMSCHFVLVYWTPPASSEYLPALPS